MMINTDTKLTSQMPTQLNCQSESQWH